jgi:hypothetical protein
VKALTALIKVEVKAGNTRRRKTSPIAGQTTITIIIITICITLIKWVLNKNPVQKVKIRQPLRYIIATGAFIQCHRQRLPESISQPIWWGKN